MRKLLIFVFCLFGMMASAEDITVALLEPLTVPGSTECTPMEISMVRGELRKAFARQSGFQPLARMDVDAMLKEQGFQRSGVVDDKQIKEIGKMTSAQYICVSKITKYKTQLYIESYLVDIETGGYGLSATQYANVRNEDYSKLPNACFELAREMLGDLNGSQKGQSHITPSNKPDNIITPSIKEDENQKKEIYISYNPQTGKEEMHVSKARGEYTMHIGDEVSLKEAQQLARDDALRNAIFKAKEERNDVFFNIIGYSIIEEGSNIHPSHTGDLVFYCVMNNVILEK